MIGSASSKIHVGTGPVSTSTIAASNQGAILDALRREGALSKADICKITRLSVATVNRVTKNLLDRGYLVHAGVAESTGGRRPIILGVAPEVIVVGAIQVHHESLVGAIVGFDGQIIERFVSELGGDGDAASGPTSLKNMIARLIACAKARDLGMRAIGVAIANIADSSGVIQGLDARFWPEFTIDSVTEDFQIPITVENDANALAIGELYRGVGREQKDFVALVLDRGLRSGIVANGAIYRGARFAAGEVGYLLLESETRGEDAFQGELEAELEPSAVTRTIGELGYRSDHVLTASELIYLSESQDDPVLQRGAENVLDRLASAVAAIATILDPGIIIFGEGIAEQADLVIPALQARLEGRIAFIPELRVASLGSDAVLLGVAEMALRTSKPEVSLAP
jgi:predicted NBD/HSP70 family sugar kinase